MSNVNLVNSDQYIAQNIEARDGRKNEAVILAVLSSLTSSIDAANAKGADKSTSSSSDNLMAQFQDAMGNMHLVISLLEELYGEYSAFQANGSMKNSNDAVSASADMAAHQSHETEKQIKKILRRDKWGFLAKVIEVVVAVVVVAATVWNNPELTAGAVALIASVSTLTALSVTGELSDITQELGKAITSGLEDLGMDSKDAQRLGNALAGAIIAVASAIVTLGAGAAGGAITSAVSDTEESLSAAAKKTLKAVAKQAGFNAAQVAMGDNTLVNFAALGIGHIDNKTVQEVLLGLTELMQLLIGITMMIAGGFSAANPGEAVEESSSSLAKVVNKMKSLTQELTGTDRAFVNNLGLYLETAMNLISTIPQIGVGINSIELGKIMESLTDYKSLEGFLNRMAKQEMEGLKSSTQDNMAFLSTLQTMLSDMVAIVKPYAGLPEALAQAI